MRLRLSPTSKLRTLDFDIENRPLSYLGMDFTTAEITAIAWSFDDQADVDVRLLGYCTQLEMLAAFVEQYDRADVVTGHYILRHDLPIINGALLEQGMAPLGPKLVSDTKVHLIKRAGISASQENLAAMFGLATGKEHLNQVEWREANRLTPAGLEQTRRRVIGDVLQHKELRARLIQAGALGPPRAWEPGGILPPRVAA
jgi:hypothetical protein